MEVKNGDKVRWNGREWKVRNFREGAETCVLQPAELSARNRVIDVPVRDLRPVPPSIAPRQVAEA